MHQLEEPLVQYESHVNSLNLTQQYVLLKILLLHLYSGPLELSDSGPHYSDQLYVDSSQFHVGQPESALSPYCSIYIPLTSHLLPWASQLTLQL